MSPYFSQIARLLKSIVLRQEDANRRPSAQFLVGRPLPFVLSGGMGMSWWYSDDTFHARDAVALLAIQSSIEFRDCDAKTVASVVMATIQEHCLDRCLFNGDLVFLHQRETLFDCRVAEPLDLATAIAGHVADALRAKISRRCTVHAVPRIMSASFAVECDSVRLISKTDVSAWQELVRRGYEFDGWSPLRPRVDAREDQTFSPPRDFEGVFVSEDHGTPDGTRSSCILKFRKLAAVLHAVASRASPHRIHKSAASAFEFLVQFPHTSAPERSLIRSDCDPVIPYFSSDVVLSSEDVNSVQSWYSTTERCHQGSRDRIEKAANFLNRALNAKDIEAYINYFIALDALFGQRGSVEQSILDGVGSLSIEPTLNEKVKWLFDLRNELVHGGSRFISEWPDHARYTQHFRTKPADDVRVLAELAVLGAPALFAA